ncbi:MAG: CRR6 family NdhI maturation factor [Cyanobacteriota bacterium]|nr:CRR6 family NdhI maturation factor [Cyanobacteriota bacterium]
MPITLSLSAEAIQTLDLSPGHRLVETLLRDPQTAAQQVQCVIDYPRALDDPRELPEIPEVRLWFIRFDTAYPWMPYFLNWRQGELARYAAMLVPHQFSAKEGILYHPEALEIFVYQKIFVLAGWMKTQKIGGIADLRNMALIFGFEIHDDFLALWEQPF